MVIKVGDMLYDALYRLWASEGTPKSVTHNGVTYRAIRANDLMQFIAVQDRQTQQYGDTSMRGSTNSVRSDISDI